MQFAALKVSWENKVLSFLLPLSPFFFFSPTRKYSAISWGQIQACRSRREILPTGFHEKNLRYQCLHAAETCI